jgi:hypothetical protein
VRVHWLVKVMLPQQLHFDGSHSASQPLPSEALSWQQQAQYHTS